MEKDQKTNTTDNYNFYDRHTYIWTWRLYDRHGPEGRVGEKKGPRQEVQWPLVYVFDFVKDVWNVKFSTRRKKTVFFKRFSHVTFHHKTVFTNMTFTT